MSALISSMEHAFAAAASDVVKVAKFVETAVPAGAQESAGWLSTIEAVTALVSPQAAKIERAGFAVLGVVIKAIEDPNAAVGANGLNVSLDGQLVSALRTSPPVVKSAVPEATTEQ